MGTLQQISALIVGEVWGLFECPTIGENASVQLRGTWERSIVRSIDGKMAEEKKNNKICFKVHCCLLIKQTIRQKFVRICSHKQL